MAVIRRLNCFDAPKIKKMISYLGNEKFSRDLFNEALTKLHTLLPLKYKFLPESFVLIEKDEIMGLITVLPTAGNPYKLNITRLVFQQNYYDVGKQLVEYVVAKYGAKGAHSFVVAVDDSHGELLELFMSGCNFRQCASESLWKVENFEVNKIDIAPFRPCQNSDAKAVSHLYNSELITLYRPSLDRCHHEYQEPFFCGTMNFYKNRYVLEMGDKIAAYLSITTSDNLNFIIDLSVNDGYQLSFDSILNFALNDIARRKKVFYPFVKLKKYTKTSESFEGYMHSKHLNFHCVQNQLLLVKDFYRPIKQAENILQVFLLGENNMISTN